MNSRLKLWMDEWRLAGYRITDCLVIDVVWVESGEDFSVRVAYREGRWKVANWRPEHEYRGEKTFLDIDEALDRAGEILRNG